jgi:hypothetical protein
MKGKTGMVGSKLPPSSKNSKPCPSGGIFGTLIKKENMSKRE